MAGNRDPVNQREIKLEMHYPRLRIIPVFSLFEFLNLVNTCKLAIFKEWITQWIRRQPTEQFYFNLHIWPDFCKATHFS